eukprot:scaffold102337_cov37-Cyclotella_meneghiniana.AAC.4
MHVFPNRGSFCCQLGPVERSQVGMEWDGGRWDEQRNGEGGGWLVEVGGFGDFGLWLATSRTMGRCFLERTLSGLWTDFERTLDGPAKSAQSPSNLSGL